MPHGGCRPVRRRGRDLRPSCQPRCYGFCTYPRGCAVRRAGRAGRRSWRSASRALWRRPG